jgi:hypothetical protein
MTAMNGAPIPNVRLIWMETSGREDTTDEDGSFRLSRLPLGASVTIKPFKNRYNDVSAVSIRSEDALRTANAAMGLTSLSSEERLAADADGDGSISMFDAFQIARAGEGFRPFDLFKVGQWIFMPESRTFSQVNQEIHDQRFRGILIGDVNGNWHGGSIQLQNESPAFPSNKKQEPAQ